jgi:phospholipase C
MIGKSKARTAGTVALGGLTFVLGTTGCSTTSGAGSVPIEVLVDSGPPDSSVCPSLVVEDGQRDARAACTFKAGAKAVDTLGISSAVKAALPIKNVIVMMQENRGYDHLFGHLSDSDPSLYTPIPDSFSNLDPSGAVVKPFHQTTTCFLTDPDHQWDAMHAQSNGGKMDGFVTSAANSPSGGDGHFVLGYYDETDLPFYYFLAKTYALADNHFPSVLSGTWPNRDYLYAGTSGTVKNTLDGVPDAPTLFDAMTTANVTWGVYSDSFPLELALEWANSHPGVHTMAEFYSALADGTLPSVAFVDGEVNAEDDHPPADLQVGEKWSKGIYDATVKSPLWKNTALIFTFDEGGGFFDHVPPPTDACIARPQDSDFFELGIRVPLVMISPWARRHYVSHVRHEHTSITRLIELLFDVPALTARDANSDALLDMFDFGCKSPAAIPDAPESGTGGCNPALDGGAH